MYICKYLLFTFRSMNEQQTFCENSIISNFQHHFRQTVWVDDDDKKGGEEKKK